MAKITFSQTRIKGIACVQPLPPSSAIFLRGGGVCTQAKKGTKHEEHDGMGRNVMMVLWRADSAPTFFSISPASEYAQTAPEIIDHPTTDRTANNTFKLAFDLILVQF